MSQVDETFNGKEVELPVGETIEVRLPENRTTGYQWVLESSAKAVSSLLNDEVEPGSLMGGPGIHHWYFRTDRAGSGHIKLSYRRPWEETEKPQRTFELDIRVS